MLWSCFRSHGFNSSLGLCRVLDVVPPGADGLSFAFVDDTKLRYGDVMPVKRRRLLGPMAAMNGVLLFG
jgi:hypothetical protein